MKALFKVAKEKVAKAVKNSASRPSRLKKPKRGGWPTLSFILTPEGAPLLCLRSLQTQGGASDFLSPPRLPFVLSSTGAGASKPGWKLRLGGYVEDKVVESLLTSLGRIEISVKRTVVAWSLTVY